MQDLVRTICLPHADKFHNRAEVETLLRRSQCIWLSRYDAEKPPLLSPANVTYPLCNDAADNECHPRTHQFLM